LIQPEPIIILKDKNQDKNQNDENGEYIPISRILVPSHIILDGIKKNDLLFSKNLDRNVIGVKRDIIKSLNLTCNLAYSIDRENLQMIEIMMLD
jgi:hypothetical protein